MKKILFLLAVLAGLVGTAVVYQNQQNARLNTAVSRGASLRELLLPGLDITAVRKIRIKDAKTEVNVVIRDDRKGASVSERGGYAASLDRISSILGELREQKISSKQQVGKGAWAEIKVQPPGENADGVGTQVELIGAEGKVLRTLILGEQISVAGGQSSTPLSGGNQRFVRIPEDGDTIWVVSNTFYDLEPKPESWLDKAFIDIQKIREVAVTPPQAADGWKAGRTEETATDFTLLDAKAGEALDAAKLPLGSLLSAPTLNDVVSKEQTAEVMKGATRATITTFDGFTYQVQVAKQSKDGADRYYLTVDVSAQIPQSRTPVKDEKEEDKKKADEAFAARKKSLEEKLAKEKSFAGWAFEVSEYTVNNLLKKRSEILKAAPAPIPLPQSAAPTAPAASVPTAPAPAPAAPAPQPPVTVTTPPVPVPTPPKAELRPAADPAAAPKVEVKK